MKLEDEVKRIACEHLKKEEPLLFETAEIGLNLVEKPNETDAKYAPEFYALLADINPQYLPFQPYYEVIYALKTPHGKRTGGFAILAETGEVLTTPKYA